MKTIIQYALCSLLLALPGLARAQSPIVDLGQLNLRVTETKVVPELRLTGQGDFRIKPDAGTKLVAITLSGELKTPGRIAVSPALLAVRYETDSVFRPGTKSPEVAGAHHIEAYADHWAASAVVEHTKPGPVTLRFAVTLQDGITRIWVGIASFGHDAATLAP